MPEGVDGEADLRKRRLVETDAAVEFGPGIFEIDLEQTKAALEVEADEGEAFFVGRAGDAGDVGGDAGGGSAEELGDGLIRHFSG